ncbi:MAG: 3-oxoacyl-ACP reductase [Rickettsiales bacterium]|nr:3-oxoacyl-ACP reductase [Rickettsiales bacterium]
MKEKRNILITGANSGIGLACVKLFLDNGDRVISIVRSKTESSLKFLHQLKSEQNLDIYFIDLENTDDLKDNLNKILTNYKNIDVLINNAGKIFNGLVQMTTKRKFSELLNLNFFVPLELTQMIVKKMMRTRKGNIINVSSTSSQDANYGRSAYSSSKAALETLTKTLAFELGRFNIRANCVLPGLTDTRLMRENTKQEVVDDEIKKIALGRIAKPEEIAELVYFLASEKSSYITAQAIRIDGGLST